MPASKWKDPGTTFDKEAFQKEFDALRPESSDMSELFDR